MNGDVLRPAIFKVRQIPAAMPPGNADLLKGGSPFPGNADLPIGGFFFPWLLHGQ